MALLARLRATAPLRPSYARQLCAASAMATDHATRLTKIVATIGPASEEAEPLAGCVAAGIDVMRVNFSHATVEEFHLRQKNLRAAPGGEYCSIMLDTKGPEIRMGGLAVCKETGDRKAKVLMTQGDSIELTNDAAFDGASTASKLYVGYERLGEVLAVGNTVLLDDGLISLSVTEVRPDGVTCEVVNTSEIGERKGVNLPGVVTGLPAMSDKDREDIRFGIEHDIDMVAASFVRNAEGVAEIKEYIDECHEKYCKDAVNSPPPLVISKIESTEALDNLQEIIDASDGIMVARGDLGVEIPIEQVVTWQKDMVAMCVAAGKPVIVATQMLESMQKNPRPTRAEVADVTNAVLEGADCVMLSGESANGKYPVESVTMQGSIVVTAEAWSRESGAMTSDLYDDDDNERAEDAFEFVGYDHGMSLAASACFMAERMQASAIIVCDDGYGEMVRAVSRHRPPMPILGLTDSLKVARQLSISRGVYPCLETEPISSPDDAVAMAATQGLVGLGDSAVVVLGESISAVTFYGDEEYGDEYEEPTGAK